MDLELHDVELDYVAYEEFVARNSPISGVAYSSLQTQFSSFLLGQYAQKISGDIVECGIAGGSNLAFMMLGAGRTKRYWGFDSFQGIQLGGKKDVLQPGIGKITHNVDVPDDELLVSSGITVVSKQTVKDNMEHWGFKDYNLRLVEGWVQKSISWVIGEIKNISILRLDMDMYAPTKYTLEKLFPLISPGGVVIIDDWGLDGARTACIEFFQENNLAPRLLKMYSPVLGIGSVPFFYK